MPDGANKGSFLQGYNAQIAVDAAAQIIVATAVTPLPLPGLRPRDPAPNDVPLPEGSLPRTTLGRLRLT